MTKYYCDKCKIEIDNNEVYEITIEHRYGRAKTIDMDICEFCKEEMILIKKL